ncbi:MAG: NADH-quinone oxidoreductase subunit NuoG [Actinomycetota bacterium]
MSETVTLTIDGKEVTVPKGTLVIRAAEQLGVEIPRFCDHPLLDPAGACRQCLVEVEGQHKMLTSCTATVTDGMVVKTQNTSEEARSSQVANLEFLLLNHPLDCPVCDRGGECPLQDQALEFGPGRSRFIEAKRTYPKPISLSPLVALDRERCVLCARCTRFCDEISGDRQIELFDRGAEQQVAIAQGEEFDSPFSGNTIQICPVGALTATTYRFAARPFDIKHVDTTCAHCASGCSIRVDARRNKIVRVLARDDDEVNEAWICDKGRFAFRSPDAENRLTTPLLRGKGMEPVSFGEAFEWIARELEGKKVGFLTGGRLRNEDYYALSKLARTVFKTNDLEGSVPVDPWTQGWAAAGGDGVTYEDVDSAPVIVVVGLDTEQESPILHLRIRKAASRGAKVFVVHPRRTRLWDVAEHVGCRPGGEVSALTGHAGVERSLTETASGRAVVLAGTQLPVTLGGSVAVWAGAAHVRKFAGDHAARFALAPRRANDMGAIRAGVSSSILPGGRPIWDADGRAEVEAAWGAVPVEKEDTAPPGGFRFTSAARILARAADRDIDALYLVGVDVLRDFPNAALAAKALENVRYLIVQDTHRTELELYADVMLPAAAHAEVDGHITDWEGRDRRVRPIRGPIGSSRPDWEIFAGLAETMGATLGFATLDELRGEMAGLMSPRKEGFPPGEPRGPETPSHGLTLFTYPLLVDEGRLSEGADELKEAQEQPAFVELHPDDATEAGVEDGAMARIRTEAGEATLPARVTDGIAKGAVFVPFNNPGLQANTLLSGSFTTPVEIEAAEPAAPAPSAEEGEA